MKKITLTEINKKYQEKEKLVCITAYDFAFASLLDAAGTEILLVGDSLGNVIQGNETTLSVTLDEIIYHTKLVKRAAKNSFIVADMPFMSYQTGVKDALKAAGKIMKLSGADAVKLEGGERSKEAIRAISECGIPVMAHIGLTPQSVKTMGLKVQGKDKKEALKLKSSAKALEDAGAFSLVLECVPSELAKEITKKSKIPTIGIGAGPDCDGQVLVMHDLLGLSLENKVPKFIKKYAELGKETVKAAKDFAKEVKDGAFPGKDNSY